MSNGELALDETKASFFCIVEVRELKHLCQSTGQTLQEKVHVVREPSHLQCIVYLIDVRCE